MLKNQFFMEGGMMEEDDRIFMNRNQLIQFTKKFALHKLEFEEKIQDLQATNRQKDRKIQNISQQLRELTKIKQQLEEQLQHLQCRHKQQLQSMIYQHHRKNSQKFQSMEELTKEVNRLKMNLEYEKQECSRYREFLKIKQQIINNLEWEKNMGKTLTITNSSASKSKSKTIIIKKKDKESLNRTVKIDPVNLELEEQRRKCFFLESENQVLRKQNKKIRTSKGTDKEKDKIKKKIVQTKTNNEKLLAEKCCFLEKQVEKLRKKIGSVELKRQSCECMNRYSQESIVEQKIQVKDFHDFRH